MIHLSNAYFVQVCVLEKKSRGASLKCQHLTYKANVPQSLRPSTISAEQYQTFQEIIFREKIHKGVQMFWVQLKRMQYLSWNLPCYQESNLHSISNMVLTSGTFSSSPCFHLMLFRYPLIQNSATCFSLSYSSHCWYCWYSNLVMLNMLGKVHFKIWLPRLLQNFDLPLCGWVTVWEWVLEMLCFVYKHVRGLK